MNFKSMKEQNKMNNNFIRWIVVLLVSGLIIAGGATFYIFNLPHRDIQSIEADYNMLSSQLVNEYLSNARISNEKYLQEEGDSKIIAVTGIVASIDKDMKDQKVVLLKGLDEKAGVRCSFMASTNVHTDNLQPGDRVTIKGVIRSGAGYDDDLELYEDVIMEKCDVIFN